MCPSSCEFWSPGRCWVPPIPQPGSPHHPLTLSPPSAPSRVPLPPSERSQDACEHS